MQLFHEYVVRETQEIQNLIKGSLNEKSSAVEIELQTDTQEASKELSVFKKKGATVSVPPPITGGQYRVVVGFTPFANLKMDNPVSDLAFQYRNLEGFITYTFYEGSRRAMFYRFKSQYVVSKGPVQSGEKANKYSFGLSTVDYTNDAGGLSRNWPSSDQLSSDKKKPLIFIVNRGASRYLSELQKATSGVANKIERELSDEARFAVTALKSKSLKNAIALVRVMNPNFDNLDEEERTIELIKHIPWTVKQISGERWTQKVESAAIEANPRNIRHIINPTRQTMNQAFEKLQSQEGIESAVLTFQSMRDPILFACAAEKSPKSSFDVLTFRPEFQRDVYNYHPGIVDDMEQMADSFDPKEMERKLRYKRVGDIAEPFHEVVVRIWGEAIKLIRNPSEEVQMAAVKQDPRNILHIQDPAPSVQRYAGHFADLTDVGVL